MVTSEFIFPQIEELIAMSSPPRVENKNYWLAADINALTGLTSALSTAVCVEQHFDGNTFYTKVRADTQKRSYIS